MAHPGESAVERTLGSLRAIDAVAPADASVVHPSARPSGPPGPPRPGPGGPGAPPSGPIATQDQAPRTLEDLYREHRMRFVRLAVLLVDDPATAEDVVQEAFTGLHRHWGRLRDEHAALGYLRTAVVNGSRSVLRRRRTAREYTPPHTADARSAESLAMLSAEHQAVVGALGKLPRRQREVLVLRYYGGLSEAEIAEATGISKGTVKSTASRGLEAIGKLVDGG
ncbi:RNA polymerase sigma-70 factor (sigma-E family) [Actinomycetospora succinea]|uniref:RNA polymerase sigma-70 factor (Sigma-E family) n=1 Tax=Actinomycetospora succinea TaxID=663603 RepID=A0A4V3D8P9_9PSEU|nr:SigE family RNA polymerase sigma factor [Actinomycetospora succinea]TDQ52661.1 RNA polymerase sigma-70 factor (sigma-E family) [Actinomycetospora succinea]